MTSDILLRLVVLLLVALVMCLLLWFGRRLVEKSRQRALSATPFKQESVDTPKDRALRVRVLAFTSEDCRQCHQFQEPVLRRVIEARGDIVSVEYIDAPSSPELTQRYQVLTLPTTVLLDATGKAQAINYGFTNAMRLLKQVDDILEQEALKID
ncbi:MAG TPA: thioredoxin family protein [Ktedonobacteraceae bacterium]|nr:thioredoxin family protein [Ktedonobacteraceae bacterium]